MVIQCLFWLKKIKESSTVTKNFRRMYRRFFVRVLAEEMGLPVSFLWVSFSGAWLVGPSGRPTERGVLVIDRKVRHWFLARRRCGRTDLARNEVRSVAKALLRLSPLSKV